MLAVPEGPSMRCIACGFENVADASFCGECAAPLAGTVGCPGCGRENPPNQKFCNGCGQPLIGSPGRPGALGPRAYTPRHLAEKILTSRSALEGERKTITALFADIKGSVELMQNLDPEDAQRIVDPALEVLMEAVHHYEGYVARTTGDGLFALFGAPIAHEDHPQRALYAALRMQERIAGYAEKLKLEKGVALQIRIGLNTGDVVVRSIRKDDLHTDYDPIGHSTNLAARMESLASAGSILVSENTYRMTEGYFQFKDQGPTKVKGMSDPVNTYEVVGVGPLRTRLEVSAKRGFVHFVGRQAEMGQLKRALELAKSGRGQIVGLIGEAGVGKSRLCHEFKLSSQTGCLVLESFAVSHGKAYPYLPLIDLLKSYFEIGLEDDERARREKITRRVLGLDRALEDRLPYLFALLGVLEPASSLQQMDPGIRRQRTFEAVKRLLLQEPRNQPVLLLFEDLHWLDNETQAFLGALGESLATSKVLLLANYRPEYRHGWSGKTYFTELRLDPLENESAEELLSAILGDEAELEALKRLILDKSEGTPFFIEEVVQGLFDRGWLARNGKVRLTRPLVEIHIPPTVEAVLAARIDRLDAEKKGLLQTAAVIGREFSCNLLERVTGRSEADLARQLGELQAAEFVYEQPASSEREYIFKHALTRDVAYNSLLVERRTRLHEATAEGIEALFGSRPAEHYSELAHHYGRSANTAKAIEYLRLAAQQAVQRSANAQAVAHLSKALELLKTLPENAERSRMELSMQIALGAPLIATRGYVAPEVESTWTRALKLCQQLGDTPQLFPAVFGLWAFYLTRSEFRTARALGKQLLNLASSVEDPGLRIVAHRALGTTLFFLGKSAQAREHLEQGIALYDLDRHRSLGFLYGQDPGASCLFYTACALWYLGYPDQALERSRQALALAREINHPFSLTSALTFVSAFHQFRREPEVAEELAREAISVSAQQGIQVWLPMANVVQGWARSERGAAEEAVKQIRGGVDAWRAGGAASSLPHLLSMLAEALRKIGRKEEALAVLADSISLADAKDERYWQPELHRLKGELLLDSAAHGSLSAEASFRQAIDIARRTSGASLELRAATSLARLLAKRGEKEEARRLLAETYGWFTEGFDTRDLREARTLLHELS
jgi:class 3 adenylate cyclase/predicted ATPase